MNQANFEKKRRRTTQRAKEEIQSHKRDFIRGSLLFARIGLGVSLQVERLEANLMAPKGTRKPSALSEEYVVDSSDDQEAIQPDQIESANPKLVFEISSKQKSTPKVDGNQKAKTASASSQSTSRSQSEEEEYSGGEEDEDELETADLLDNRAKQASSKSSSSKERPKKKPKTAYVLFSAREDYGLTLTDLVPSTQSLQSRMIRLQASSDDTPERQILLL